MTDDLRHVKWKMMKQRGISEKEADDRIESIKELKKKEDDREKRKHLYTTTTTKKHE